MTRDLSVSGVAIATPDTDTCPELLVVGSGVAGLAAAVEARAAGLRVLVVTKAGVADTSTAWAQGGVAVALPGDSVAAHAADTRAAGAGLCDEAAVRSILTAGPEAVGWLRALGARFDVGDDGLPARTREGGHGAFRVIHAGGDATGAEVERALVASARDGRVPVLERHTVVGLRRDELGVTGADLVDNAGRRTALAARAVMLATGGVGRLYTSTTNPSVATGDGLALALRAGAAVADVEFVQFHPTALWTGAPDGQLPLVTEAVRGEGGVLLDHDGCRVMAGVHPLEDMAPRDVVAAAIARRLAGTGREHVWLDATGLDDFAARFPTVSASCRAIGVDPERDPIPVTPAAHYLCGGVAVDAYGRTGVPGLYAAGEVARTGLHGANRLASNSLLEGLVLGRRVAGAVAADGGTLRYGRSAVPTAPAVDRGLLRRAASAYLGLGRDAAGLDAMTSCLDRAAPVPLDAPRATADAALTLLARAVTLAAAERRETRGCHVRHDAPYADDARRHSLFLRLSDPDDDRSLTVTSPLGAAR